MEQVNKERKIGSVTFGIMLIIVGISVVLMTFTGFELLRYVLVFWPVAIILLGVEILYDSFTRKTATRIDFSAIILMCITLFLTAVFSVGNYAVNKLLYDEDIKSLMVNEWVSQTRFCDSVGGFTVKTGGDERIAVRFISTDTAEDLYHVEWQNIYETEGHSIAEIVEYENELESQSFKEKERELEWAELPDFVKKVTVTVRGPREENLIIK